LPPARLAALREAFQQAIASPQMKEEFEKMGSPLTPLSGADLAEAITKIFSAPKPIIELARKAQQPPP
jgi:tripartite-type tricarboxylate transporter receptor subunit TctC